MPDAGRLIASLVEGWCIVTDLKVQRHAVALPSFDLVGRVPTLGMRHGVRRRATPGCVWTVEVRRHASLPGFPVKRTAGSFTFVGVSPMAAARAGYDLAVGSLRSLLLVLDGTIRFGRTNASPNRTGAVAESVLE